MWNYIFNLEKRIISQTVSRSIVIYIYYRPTLPTSQSHPALVIVIIDYSDSSTNSDFTQTLLTAAVADGRSLFLFQLIRFGSNDPGGGTSFPTCSGEPRLQLLVRQPPNLLPLRPTGCSRCAGCSPPGSGKHTEDLHMLLKPRSCIKSERRACVFPRLCYWDGEERKTAERD